MSISSKIISGSVRMVLSEERHEETYKASVETAAAGEEEQLFGEVDAADNPLHPGNELYDTRWDKPAAWTTNNSNKVSKLFATTNYSGSTIGPNVLLKVMAGDGFIVNTITTMKYLRTWVLTTSCRRLSAVHW